MIDFGIVKPGRTLYVPFDSFAASTGAPSTISGFAVSDIQIYKDGGTTQRASTSGFTLLDTDGIDFDGITGINGFSIDLSDNTTADFYQAGSRYFVVISTITVDSQTVSFVACTFSIGHPDAVANTFIATLSSQTSFTLNAGPAEDDALNGMWAIIHDAASAVQCAVVQISDYVGASKTVTLAGGATFTVAAKDNISIMGPMPLQPTVGAIQSPGRTLSVGTDNASQADAAKINGVSTSSVTTVNANIGTTQPTNFTGTGGSALVKTDVQDFGGTAGSFTSGKPDVNIAASVAGAVGSVTSGVTVTTNNDKTGYGLSSAAVQAIWDAATSALTTVGSIGKWILDKLDVVVSTRLASSSYTAPDNTSITAIKAKTDQLVFTNANTVDASLQNANAVATAAAQKIADIMVRRTMANVEASANGDTLDLSSLYGLIEMLQEASASGATLTVRKTDGTTLGTKTLTSNASADPITGIT